MSTAESQATTYYVAQRGDQLFGFDTNYVRESSNLDQLRVFPGTRPELVGVVNLRNTVLPILLPDRWLLPDAIEYDPAKPIIVISHNKITFGIQIDRTKGVLVAEESAHHPHPYEAETGYFSHLVAMADGTIFTSINVESLIHQIGQISS